MRSIIVEINGITFAEMCLNLSKPALNLRKYHSTSDTLGSVIFHFFHLLGH